MSKHVVRAFARCEIESDSEYESEYEDECDPQVDEFGNTIETTSAAKPKPVIVEDKLPPAPVEIKVVRYCGQENNSAYKERKEARRADERCRAGWIESGQLSAAGYATFGAADDISIDLSVVSKSVRGTYGKNRNTAKSAWEEHVEKQRQQSKLAEEKRRRALLGEN